MNEDFVERGVSNDMQTQGPGHKMSRQISCVCLAPTLAVCQCRFVAFLESITGGVSGRVSATLDGRNVLT